MPDTNEINHNQFRDFFSAIEPIRMRDPLAALLGAFQNGDDVIEYGFSDVVKMAGHACPTVSSGFVACKHAVRALFPNGIGERGAVTIFVHGERDDGVFGVIGQVFSFITGACPESGFKGIGGLHRRNNLLRFDFVNTETEKGCRAIVNLAGLPPLESGDEKRMGLLLQKNVWQGATDNEQIEFRDLWMKRVQMIALEERNLTSWLNIEAMGA